MLDQIISSAVADANITANGSGALTVVSATMTAAGTGLTVQHNALVSGVLTTTGNHVANGGMNINTIRDNVGGNTAIDLSAGTGNVKLPHGTTLTGGTHSLLAGGLSRMVYTKIAGVTTTPAFFNHNLGTTPDFCIVNIPGTSSALFNAYWDDTTMTSTQVKLTSNSAGGITVGLIAIKQ